MFWLWLSTLQLLCIIQAGKYLYIAKKANYSDARRLCKAHGLDLVQVTSEKVQQDLNNLYEYKRSECGWLGVHYNGEGFDYSDGTAVRYTDWEYGEPDDLHKAHCVVIKRSNLKWKTRRCGQTYSSLCGPYEPDDAYKVKVFSHHRGHQDLDITSHPTYVAPQTSLLSCAKDCAILKCHYFSLDGKQCKVFTDNTELDTQPKKGSTIWKRN